MPTLHTLRALLPTLALVLATMALILAGGCGRGGEAQPAEVPPAGARAGGGGAPAGTVAPAEQPEQPGQPGQPGELQAGAPTGEPRSSKESPPALPPRPNQPGEMLPVINGWLAGGGSPEHLSSLAGAWGAWGSGDRLQEADLDADGQPEYLLPLRWQPPGAPSPLQVPGYLLAVRRNGTVWQAGPVPVAGEPVPAGPETTAAVPVSGPGLVAVTDLTRDGRPEVVAQSRECGAHTCFLTLSVHNLNPAGEWQTLLVVPDLPGGEARVQGEEVRIFAGGVGSVGAGPQRNESRTYRWDGRALVETAREVAPSRYAHFRLVDGNAAAAAGDIDGAKRLYQELLSDDGRLEYWADPELETPFLKALARFRLLVLAARSGQAAEVAALAAAAEQADGPYARWARAFLEAAGAGGAGWEDGCRAAAATWNLSEQEPPAYWGYSHPPFGPGSLCPELGSGLGGG